MDTSPNKSTCRKKGTALIRERTLQKPLKFYTHNWGFTTRNLDFRESRGSRSIYPDPDPDQGLHPDCDDDDHNYYKIDFMYFNDTYLFLCIFQCIYLMS